MVRTSSDHITLKSSNKCWICSSNKIQKSGNRQFYHISLINIDISMMKITDLFQCKQEKEPRVRFCLNSKFEESICVDSEWMKICHLFCVHYRRKIGMLIIKMFGKMIAIQRNTKSTENLFLARKLSIYPLWLPKWQKKSHESVENKHMLCVYLYIYFHSFESIKKSTKMRM